ncbi:MAG: PTS sugar transporter subunit IIA, partial [Fusobacteriaceae bacterium]
KLASYLNPDFIFTNLETTTVEDTIKFMVNKMANSDANIKKNSADIIAAIIKRENEISTAIGSGIMLPHARFDNFGDFLIAIGSFKKPITVPMPITNEPTEVKLVFLIIADVLSNNNILKTMGAISKLCLNTPEVIEKIKEQTSKHDIIEIIEETNIQIAHNIVAGDIMTTDVLPVSPETTLDVVAKRFVVEQTSGLPVVNENELFLGEITEKELIAFGMPDYAKLEFESLNFLTVGVPFQEYLVNEKTTTIKNIYRKENVHIIDSKTPIMEICFIMIKEGATRLYVVEKGKYCGVIKRADIIKKVLHI